MKFRALALALLAFLGMIDTLYLGLKRGGPPIPCRITTGCEDVLNSEYSELAGIPISWFGFVFYLAVFSCAVFSSFGAPHLLKWVFWPALAAFAVTLVLVGIQAFVLEAYCEYCLGSAILVTLIFLLSPWPRRRLADKVAT
jgi:uncharacterized membrane protein